jgi:hypothetical protein
MERESKLGNLRKVRTSLLSEMLNAFALEIQSLIHLLSLFLHAIWFEHHP